MNHRTGLFDAVLIKDNHLALAADEHITPADAVRKAREFLAQTSDQREGASLIVEIEIDRLDQLDVVLAAGPDIVMLDNMRPDLLREAVARRDTARPIDSTRSVRRRELEHRSGDRRKRRRPDQRWRSHPFRPGPRRGPRLASDRQELTRCDAATAHDRKRRCRSATARPQ